MRERNRNLTIVLITVCLCSPSTLIAGDAVTLQAERDLNDGLYQGKATISVQHVKIARGADVALDARYINHGVPYLFNPYFNRLTDQPAILAIFDSEKHYIGDLRRQVLGSYVRPGIGDWVQIPAGGYAGVTLGFTAGMVPGTQFMGRGNELPAGKYYVQLIYRRSFATKAPTRGDSATIEPNDLDAWFRHGAALDLFRSNILEIELVDR